MCSQKILHILPSKHHRSERDLTFIFGRKKSFVRRVKIAIKIWRSQFSILGGNSTSRKFKSREQSQKNLQKCGTDLQVRLSKEFAIIFLCCWSIYWFSWFLFHCVEKPSRIFQKFHEENNFQTIEWNLSYGRNLFTNRKISYFYSF